MEATLPEPASERLAELHDAEMDARGVVSSCVNRINELNNAIAMAPESENVPRYEAEISRLSVRQMEQQGRVQHLAAVNARLREFVHVTCKSAEIEEAPAVMPKVLKGETTKQAIGRARDQIAALQAEHRKTKAASPPIADLKAAAKAHVAAVAAKGAPRVTATHDEFKFEFISDYGPRPNIEGILAWLFPDALLAKFNADLDDRPKVGLELSATEKKERMAALAIELLSLERHEEVLLKLAAQQEGIQILPRREADPRAILGVIVKRRAAFAA